MGAPPQPTPALGSQLNDQLIERLRQQRSRVNPVRTSNDEMFATLIKSGQKPYRSTYDPEQPGAIAGGVNPETFMFSNLFDQG